MQLPLPTEVNERRTVFLSSPGEDAPGGRGFGSSRKDGDALVPSWSIGPVLLFYRCKVLLNTIFVIFSLI